MKAIYGSVGNIERIKRECAVVESAGMLAPIYGVRLIADPHLPDTIKKRTGKIISHDRFCEYEAADMSWAEPLGLASWETVDVPALFEFDESLLWPSMSSLFLIRNSA